jgi:predicted RNA-binding Zn-ribbon protein involved in translation (DUF1610 family)
MKDIKIEMKGSDSEIWKGTTLNNFYEVLKITRSIIRDREMMEKGTKEYSPSNLFQEYTENKALWSIATGKIISTPVLEFRLADGINCPKCGVRFVKKYGSLSRRDNKTYICSACGTLEGIEDLVNR